MARNIQQQKPQKKPTNYNSYSQLKWVIRKKDNIKHQLFLPSTRM